MRGLTLFLVIIHLLFSGILHAQKPIKLFNQKNLSGWYAFSAETGKHSNAADLFTVNMKMIRMFGSSAGYLMTNKSFRNFRLEVEYRWNTDSTFVRKNDKKNSGVMYLVPEDCADMLWPKGIQYQIKEGSTGDFVLLHEVTLTVKGEASTPGASVVLKRFTDAEKPVGEWNSIVITVDDRKIRQELNGVLVNEATNTSESAGRILLQYEGFPIDFRKVEVSNLNQKL
jgi:hypothetical protein